MHRAMTPGKIKKKKKAPANKRKKNEINRQINAKQQCCQRPPYDRYEERVFIVIGARRGAKGASCLPIIFGHFSKSHNFVKFSF